MTLELQNISKSFDGMPVLRNLNLSFHQGQCYCLMSPSGSGKTPLLRIIMGLEQADQGLILADGKPQDMNSLTVSAVFQEDRLCEAFSPIENVSMGAGRSVRGSRIRWELARLLPEECLNRPVSTLCGGLKRRVAVMRALLTPSRILLMDEPFTGMDDELKRNVISYIREKQDGRLLILSTHQEEDVELIGGELVKLESCMYDSKEGAAASGFAR